MDKNDALKIAYQYAQVVDSRYSNSKMYLFGSYAKGNFHEDSDIDIAVVFKDFDNLQVVQLELMRLRRKIDSRIEPHLFRESDFDASNPIVSEILQYGQIIANVVA